MEQVVGVYTVQVEEEVYKVRVAEGQMWPESHRAGWKDRRTSEE